MLAAQLTIATSLLILSFGSLHAAPREVTGCQLQGHCTGVSLGSTNVDTEYQCLEFCLQHTTCTFYTFNASSTICTALLSCLELETSCSTCISGDKACTMQTFTTGSPTSSTSGSTTLETDRPSHRPTKTSPAAPAFFNKIFLATGRNAETDVELMDPPSQAASATQVTCPKQSNYPMSVEGAFGTVIDDRVMVCGGKISPEQSLSSCFEFDPEDNQWDQSEHGMTRFRAFAGSVRLSSGEWWVGGGRELGNDGYLATVETFNPESSSWTSETLNLPQPLSAFCAVAIDNHRLFIAGGRTSKANVTGVTYIYDFSKKEIMHLESMYVAREAMACSFYEREDGLKYVVVAGGFDSEGRNSDAVELFELQQNYWFPGPRLPLTISGASFVPDGRDLVMTGGNRREVLVFRTEEASWLVLDQKMAKARPFSVVEPVNGLALHGC